MVLWGGDFHNFMTDTQMKKYKKYIHESHLVQGIYSILTKVPQQNMAL